MKKIIVSLLFLLTSPLLFGYALYMDESSGKEYLFLGSMKDDQKKWLDLEKNTIVWMDDKQLQNQSGQLNPGEFYEKIIGGKLSFYADGAKPYWAATISDNKLILSKSDGARLASKITMYLNKDPVDRVFILMFHSDSHKTYGTILMRSTDTPCDFTFEEEVSIFEVFINSQGDVIKGCARLEKM